MVKESKNDKLRRYCEEGRLQKVVDILNKGANVNNVKQEDGCTALHWACRNSNNIELVRLLIDKGADVNAKDVDDCWTALNLACSYSNNIELVRLLIDKGADVNARQKNSWTALHFTCRNSNNIGLARLLIDKGADVNAKDVDCWTALHLACRYSNNIDLVRLLIDKGADVNARQEDGCWTALHHACRLENIEMAKLLVQRGASFTTRNNENKTPLDLASSTFAETLRAESTRNTEIPTFFIKMFESDNRNINLKIYELIGLIQDVHHARIFYTYLSIAETSNAISTEDRKHYTQEMLEQTVETISNTDSIVIYKMILKKARTDKLIDDATKIKLDQQAELKHIENAPFVKDIHIQLEKLSIRMGRVEARVDNLERRVNDLDTTVTQICSSIDTIHQAFKSHLRVKAVTGCMGAILNAISFGVAGSAVEGVASAVMSNIVDFSDIEHIQEVIDSVGDFEVIEAAEIGVSIAQKVEENRLNETVLQEMQKLETSGKISQQQLPIVHATIVSGLISCEMAEKKNDKLRRYCKEGHLENVVRILNEGADVNAKDVDCWTALHCACFYSSNIEIVRLLIDKGADVNAKQDKGCTALHYACRISSNIEIVRLLIDKGVDVNAKQDKGWTALHCACRLENIENAKLLVQRGASITTRNNENKTPLDLASSRTFVETLRAESTCKMNNTDAAPTRTFAERLVDLADNIDLVFEPNMKFIDKISFLEEEYGIGPGEGTPNNRIERLEDQLS